MESGWRLLILDPKENASDSLSPLLVDWTASALRADVDLRAVLAPRWNRKALVSSRLQLTRRLPTWRRKSWGRWVPTSRTQLARSPGLVLPCLIDRVPTIGNALAAALYASDYVLSPIEPERYSIKGIKRHECGHRKYPA